MFAVAAHRLMDRGPAPGSRPRARPLRIELLEDRWLPSGLPAPPNVVAPRTAAVQVVEWAVAGDDADSDVKIPASRIPLPVLAALDARFPGAELGEAELSSDEGTPLYEVSAEFRGRPIELAVTPEGQIVENEQALAARQLPRPVLDWVRQTLPGAQITEAERVIAGGGVRFEVLITTPTGQQIEATLRLEDTPLSAVSALPPIVVPNQTANDGSQLRTTDHGLQTEGVDPTAPATPLPPESWDASDARADTEAQAPAASEQPQPQGPADSTKAMVEVDPNTPVPDADLLVETSKAPWLPPVAGVISDLLPVDAAAVEQGLQQLLDAIDALAETAVGDTDVRTVVSRFVMAAVAVTGVRMLVAGLRRGKREPVLASDPTESSWNWVLGTATPEQP